MSRRAIPAGATGDGLPPETTEPSGAAYGTDLRVGHGDGLVHHAEPPAGRRRRGSGFGRFLALLILAALAWSAWAAAAFYDFTNGLRDGDSIVLERRIDWATVREALQEDLPSVSAAPAGDRGAGTMSRRAITELLRTTGLGRPGAEAATPVAWPFDAAPFPWRRIRYAFFTGGPVMFRVDLNPASGGKEPMVLLFRWSGDWRLTRIVLPAQMQLASRLVAAASPPVSNAAAASSEPGRALLYEEVLDNKDGRRSAGTVTWRTTSSPSPEGGAANVAVIAHVSIPERPLDMTMTIRRNLDAALPATHTFEIDFKEPTASGADAITGMLNVAMKPDEASPGETLTGSHVKVRDGFFLLGLSALAVDAERNLPLLKREPWLGIPIRFKNGTRGVLAIEKGGAGSSSLANAFAQWDAAASAANTGKDVR